VVVADVDQHVRGRRTERIANDAAELRRFSLTDRTQVERNERNSNGIDRNNDGTRTQIAFDRLNWIAK
jgi:hypothetical protein